MGRYLLRRLLFAPAVLLVLATLSFFLMRSAPGGPFDSERPMTPEAKQAQLEKYGLDRPLMVQYLRWMGRTLQGDLDVSVKQSSRRVNEIVAEHLPPSLLLGGVALLIALLIGLTAGIWAALRHNRWGDHAAMLAAMLGLCLPSFVIGPLLVLFFAMHWRLLPAAGYHGIGSPAYLVLPALTLALPFAARIARLTRAGMLEVLHQDFVRTARAKGLSESSVVLGHALRGGLLPVVAYLGPAAAYMLTGSLVVEDIFGIPGLGTEFVKSAINRDHTLAMGTVLVYGAFIIAANLAADLLLGLLDPRVRLR